MLKTYKRKYWYEDAEDRYMIRDREVIADENNTIVGEKYVVETFEDFESALNWFETHSCWNASVRRDIPFTGDAVILEYWGSKGKLTKKTFTSPAKIIAENIEIKMTLREILDMYADDAIKYIKERW